MQPEAQKSFIYLGPVKRLEDIGRVCVIGNAEVLSKEDFEVLKSFFTENLHAPHKSEALDTRNPTHVLMLVSDLVDLLLVSTRNELITALAYFGISMNESLLMKYAILLRFFSLISIEKRGAEVFFVQTRKSDAPWIDYSARQRTGTERFHRARFKIDSEHSIKMDSLRKSVWEQRT